MKNKYAISLSGLGLVSFLAFWPNLTQAAPVTDFKSLLDLIISTILDPLVAFLIAVAVIIVLWGVVKYITKGDDQAERTKGASLILYGIVGLFVMISIWGFVNILVRTFSLSTNQPAIPNIDTL